MGCLVRCFFFLGVDPGPFPGTTFNSPAARAFLMVERACCGERSALVALPDAAAKNNRFCASEANGMSHAPQENCRPVFFRGGESRAANGGNATPSQMCAVKISTMSPTKSTRLACPVASILADHLTCWVWMV